MNKIHLSFLLLVTLAFAGCQKGSTGPAGAAGPAGPSLKGQISGYVNLYDEYGSKVLTGMNLVQIALIGTSATATPNDSGYYTFPNLSTGIYSFKATQPNYGSLLVPSQQFTGGGTLQRDFKLSEIPNYGISKLNTPVDTTVSGMPYLRIAGTVSTTDVRERYVLLAVSNQNNISVGPNPSYLIAYTKPTNLDAKLTAYTTNFSFTIPESDLTDVGLSIGNTIYLTAYAVSGIQSGASSYEDPATGLTVYTAINTTTIASQTSKVP
jgi:hypothetical protein